MPDFKARQRKLRSLMERDGLRGILVTDRIDIFYYTGYKASENAFLLVKKSRARLFVSELDNEAADRAKAEVVFYKKPKEVASHLSGKTGVDYAMPARDLLELRRLARKAKLKDAGKVVKEPRSVKDDWEIKNITKAVRLTKTVMGSVRAWGKTEKDVATWMEMEFIKRGSRRAYPPIVSAGRNSYFVHHVPGKGRITKSPVILDAGARVNGYCSDITRTLLRNSTHKQKEILEDVKTMQSEIIDFLEPGRKFSEVQKFWERLMREKRYKVLHSFGHGVGLDIHEPLDVIKEGSVLTVEPGIYTKKHGGFRIEDVVAVGKRKTKVIE